MYALSPEAQTKLEAYTKHIAELNGATNLNAPFDITAPVERKLIEMYQLQTDFLKKINIVQVKEAHGQKLGLGSTQTFASTTDTRIQPRRPTSFGDLEALDDYLCTQTDYDTAIDWRLIDNWASLPDFYNRLANFVVNAIARDKQRIGFNGTHRAKTSNRELYPNLEDVNKGWLQKIRDYSPERAISGLKVGAGQDYKNLDALVEMAKNELIAEQYRNSDDLVVITSRGMAMNKYIPLLNQELQPTQQVAAETLYARKQLGTSDIDMPSYFPANAILITSFKNLSIYLQKGSSRRFFKPEPEWNRNADYQSVNECYVVEDYNKVALLENIEVV